MNDYSGIGRGLFGIAVLLGIAIFFSRDRKNINWRLVVVGMAVHFLVAFLMLKVPVFHDGIDYVSRFFIKLLNFSEQGAAFLFGSLVTDQKTFGYVIAFHVMPSIIFFSAFSSLLYYFDILPRVVQIFAWLLSRTFKISGAECAAATANVILDQTASPILIKPYLADMNRAQLFAVMTAGMATIGGSVMMAFISILGGDDPETQVYFATHLLTASMMSVPASLTIARIIFPSNDKVDNEVVINREEVGVNAVDAISNGTGQGLQVAMIVGATLIAFTALIALLNWGFEEGIGSFFGLNEWVADVTHGTYSGFTLQFVLGVIFAPFAWLIGASGDHLFVVGQLIGEKVVMNEFVGYISMGQAMEAGRMTDPFMTLISVYALCGFANFTSMGVQISGLGTLAPTQRENVSRMVIFAVLSGNIVGFMNACMAGLFY